MFCWYVYERKSKIELFSKDHQLIEYSICSTIEKCLEAALIDPYTPRSDKNIYGFKKFNDYCDNNKFLKVLRPHIICVITSIVFLAENIIILSIVHTGTSQRLQGNIFWLIASIVLSLLGSLFMILYRFHQVKNETEISYKLRDVGKLNEFFQLQSEQILLSENEQ